MVIVGRMGSKVLTCNQQTFVRTIKKTNNLSLIQSPAYRHYSSINNSALRNSSVNIPNLPNSVNLSEIQSPKVREITIIRKHTLLKSPQTPFKKLTSHSNMK